MLERLRAPLGPRPPVYNEINPATQSRDVVAWYWRIAALAAFLIILGGFMILPITFAQADILRASATGIGIFAVVLVAAGYMLTGLLCLAVKVPIFQVESVFIPALVASVLGLLTVFYSFLVYKPFVWNIPAALVIVASAVSSVIYGFLVLYTYRKIHLANLAASNGITRSQPTPGVDNSNNLWQDRLYYENYVPNMFPTSVRSPPVNQGDRSAVTEDEMQRRQMLHLLMQQQDASTNHGLPSNTFHIDWEDRDEDDLPPPHGYYAPLGNAVQPPPPPFRTATTDGPRHRSNDSGSFVGVWRTSIPAPVPPIISREAQAEREERRRQIEMSN